MSQQRPDATANRVVHQPGENTVFSRSDLRHPSVTGNPQPGPLISSSGLITQGGEPAPITSSPDGETDGVALLVAMAKRGEIDPWNLDIVAVTDRYLKAVAELQASDLKITGKTLLYLAILLRMKSDQLAGINYLNPPEEFLDDGLEPDFMDEIQIRRPRLHVRSLDEVIKRRTSTKQPRIRTVTLEDLLRELKRYEELEARRALQEKVEKTSERRMRNYADFTADDIEEMAHEEFHEDNVLRLRDVLERLLLDRERVSLDDIMHAGRLDRISAYLALLFLTVQGDFELEQEAFYQELYVVSTDIQAGLRTEPETGLLSEAATTLLGKQPEADDILHPHTNGEETSS